MYILYIIYIYIFYNIYYNILYVGFICDFYIFWNGRMLTNCRVSVLKAEASISYHLQHPPSRQTTLAIFSGHHLSRDLVTEGKLTRRRVKRESDVERVYFAKDV